MGYAARQRAAGADLAEATQQPPLLSWPRCIDGDVAEVITFFVLRYLKQSASSFETSTPLCRCLPDWAPVCGSSRLHGCQQVQMLV